MTAAVAPLPITFQMQDASTEARKRRREILASQRSNTLDPSKALTATLLSDLPAKRRKVLVASTTKPKPVKKPQMKYDPDVPMTKEEAAVWRREQRRKRNRESAAASRQRQRDRIVELEVEVEGWKTKVQSIMEKIKKLEEASGKKEEDYYTPEQSLPMVESVSKFVSPPTSPLHSPFSAPIASPVGSSSIVFHAAQVTPKEEIQVIGGAELEHSRNLISRPAES